MEEVTLSETETRYFSDLFLCCDVEKTGKIPMLKATELYRSANLPDDVIFEITSLSGIPPTALHISRAQFYSCLKLIAAQQAAMPLRQELLAATVQLPLPRFSWKDSPSGSDAGNNIATPVVTTIMNTSAGALNGLNALPAVPPLPTVVGERKNSMTRHAGDWQDGIVSTDSRRNSLAHQQQQQQQTQLEAAIHSDVQSTDSEVEQNESSCGGGEGGGADGCTGSNSREAQHHRRRVGSPEAWSTNSDSPTPTNSVAERPWAKETLWHGLLGDEHRQLLGTEEESSDRHSSDDDNNESNDLETIYQITPEQREYYFKQFKAVQHDPNGLLSGHVARVFFEKSRIPVEELRHIWQLCDVTRDGALSLAEFTAAMHLVVLRRNNIPLPTLLPACLYPSVLQHATLASQSSTALASSVPQEPPEADLLHLNDDDEEDNTDNTIVGSVATAASRIGTCASEKNAMNLSTLSTSSQASTSSRSGVGAANHASLSPPPPPPPVKNRSISNSPNVESTATPPNGNKSNSGTAPVKPKDRNLWAADVPPTQWTKFTESPTSNVSSPGPKPVNFDMQRTAQAVVSDPQILHPVPLRVTPVAGAVANSSGDSLTQETLISSETAIVRDNSPKQLTIVAGVASAGNGQQPATLTTATASTTAANVVAAHQRDSLQSNDLRAIQRPQAKKLPAKNIGALPPPPQRESSIGSVGSSSTALGDASDTPTGVGANSQQPQSLPPQSLAAKKDPPPLPPPRPHRHGRSSSLDLNKFKMSAPSGQQPEMTAQASFDLQTSTGFADFTHFPDGYTAPSAADAGAGAATTSQPPPQSLPPQVALPPTRFSLQSQQSNQRVSAFEVYRKPYASSLSSSQSPTAATGLTPATVAANDHVPHHHPQPTQPPPPAPFGAGGAAAIAQLPSTTASLPNADLYEKRVSAISETLRHVSFRPDNSMTDILRHLRDQNNLLLRLCNDLSDELLTVQTRKEELRVKLDAAMVIAPAPVDAINAAAAVAGGLTVVRTGSSISAPVTANATGGSGSSGVHSNV